MKEIGGENIGYLELVQPGARDDNNSDIGNVLAHFVLR